MLDENTSVISSSITNYKSIYENGAIGFDFHSFSDESVFASNLLINLGKNAHRILFEVDEDIPGFKFFIHDAVADATEKIKAKYSIQDLITLTNEYQ